MKIILKFLRGYIRNWFWSESIRSLCDCVYIWSCVEKLTILSLYIDDRGGCTVLDLQSSLIEIILIIIIVYMVLVMLVLLACWYCWKPPSIIIYHCHLPTVRRSVGVIKNPAMSTEERLSSFSKTKSTACRFLSK